MLQSIFRRTVYKNLPTILSAKCSTQINLIRKKEINRVTLVGTVFGQFKNDYGQKLIRVKTYDDGSDNYQIHVLHTSIPQDYEAGQRVFVGGTLNSKDIVITSDNKKRNQPFITAYQIYALNSIAEDEKKAKDLNSVEILTSVCSDVLNKDDHSIFQIVTHIQNLTTKEYRPKFHSVMVLDQDWTKFVSNNLEKGDRVYIRGSLNWNSVTDADGMKKTTGWILAETIDKVTKPSRQSSEQDISAFAE